MWKGSTISKIKSGLPIAQPSVNCGTFGKSALLPSGAPPSTQSLIVATSASLKLGSFENLPTAGSAPHGGISRATTFCLTARAHGRASSYVISDIGAMPVGRWHSAQFLYRIGATSFVNVGGAAAAGTAVTR